MPYIHELPQWPDLTWVSDPLLDALARTRHKQGRLLGRMGGLGFAIQSESSLATLTSDVVTTSAIEGESLSAAEVRSSIARRLGLDGGGLAPAARHVEGIVDVTLDATRRYDAPLSAERLCGWHAALFPTGWSGSRRITVGAWRPADAGAMQVVSGPLGREKVHYEAPEAARLGGEMARFLAWFNGPAGPDPVLGAAVAHLWFVTIHPFEDGNGRIARAIADMALARADGSADRFYSMSSRLAAERRDYYGQLEQAQRGTTDITRWLAWFLGCLDRALDAADLAIDASTRKAQAWERINRGLNRGAVNDRQRVIVNRLLDGFEGKLTSSKYAALAKCSTDTALRDIRELLDRGALVQNPEGGRSTSYRLAEGDPGGVGSTR